MKKNRVLFARGVRAGNYDVDRVRDNPLTLEPAREYYGVSEQRCYRRRTTTHTHVVWFSERAV